MAPSAAPAGAAASGQGSSGSAAITASAPNRAVEIVEQQRLGRQGRDIIQTVACPAAMRRVGPWSFADFAVQRMLGEGPMSSVVQCTCSQSGLPVAIKMYHKDRMNSLNIKQVAREIEIHASLLHPRIIQLYTAFEDPDGIYLVMEYAPKGDLFAELARRGGYMQESQVVQAVLAPFLSALVYLHDQGILHRDIKPENILQDAEGGVKVGDFGLAINILKERPVSRVGTLDYMPPEIVRLPRPSQAADPPHKPAERPPSYGLPVDVWCVGILAYELLVGGPPFETQSREETYTQILKMQPYLPTHLSPQAKDFLCQCLRKEASERPTAAQLLRHPWMRLGMRTSSSDSKLSQLGLAQSGSRAPAPTPTTPGGANWKPVSLGQPLEAIPSSKSDPCLVPLPPGKQSPGVPRQESPTRAPRDNSFAPSMPSHGSTSSLLCKYSTAEAPTKLGPATAPGSPCSVQSPQLETVAGQGQRTMTAAVVGPPPTGCGCVGGSGNCSNEWINIEAGSPEGAGCGEGIPVAAAAQLSAHNAQPASTLEAAGKVFIRVNASTLPPGPPAEHLSPYAYDHNSSPLYAAAGLIPAARPMVPPAAAQPCSAGGGGASRRASGGSPRGLAGIKSRLGKVLQPAVGAGSPSGPVPSPRRPGGAQGATEQARAAMGEASPASQHPARAAAPRRSLLGTLGAKLVRRHSGIAQGDAEHAGPRPATCVRCLGQ